MYNEHNPIAQRINALQTQWIEQRLLQPKAQFVRWLINETDNPLVHGFYKVESSPYGKIKETLVVMLTDFTSKNNYAYELTKDWLHTYQKEKEKYPELQWKDFDSLYQRFTTLSQDNTEETDAFFIEMLQSFKQYENQKTPLYIGINPRLVKNQKALCDWICNCIENLPKNIGIVVTDYKEGRYFESIFENEDISFERQTIVLRNQNMQGAYQDLMTQGNPNDPEIAFRKCMVQMSKATSNGELQKLIRWGEKGLQIAKNTTNLVFMASAHLIYGGFLFGFKDTERIEHILNKGIQIGEKEPDNPELVSVLLQLYGYKAAYYSILKKRKKAGEWFVKQATLAQKHQQDLVTLSAYKNALFIYQKAKETEEIEEIAPKAFDKGIQMQEEILKTTEFPYIAKIYIDLLEKTKENQEDQNKINAIDEQMCNLFGKQWYLQGLALWKKAQESEQEPELETV